MIKAVLDFPLFYMGIFPLLGKMIVEDLRSFFCLSVSLDFKMEAVDVQ
jgi:hypothetical protein